jgi:Heterokaryon incompatibility protein (HET)
MAFLHATCVGLHYSSRLTCSFPRPVWQFALTQSSSYVYQPLYPQEVRLIELLPGEGTDDIKCTIKHVSLEDGPCYQALSYCWGDTKASAEIYCNNSPLGVTENLFSALCQLRHKRTPTTFWIDAICINQVDVEERNSQVRQMRKIFQRSQRTLIWLGKESDDSDAAMQLVKDLVHASQKAAKSGIHRNVWYHTIDNIPPLYSSVWRAFSTLLKRPWFYRTWIIQEVSVSKDAHVLCGDDSVSWDSLAQAVNYALDVGIFFLFSEDMTYHALTIAGTRLKFLGGIRPRLLSLLLQNRSFLATDARDKVFALLALADHEELISLHVEPNYGLSAEKVYNDLAVAFLKSRQDLDLFNAPRVLENARIKGLPSWVPDWSTSDACVPLSFRGTSSFGDSDDSEFLLGFKAAGDSTSSPSFDYERNLLGLSGVRVDQIEAAGRLSQSHCRKVTSHLLELFSQSCDLIELLIDWEDIVAARSRSRYVTGEKRLDAYWQTLCAGYMPEGLESAKRDFRYRWYKYLRPLRLLARLAIKLFPRSEKDSWYNRSFYFLCRTAWRLLGLTPSKIPQIGFPPQMVFSNGRQIIRTRNGYIGLAPCYTQPGDWIGIFKGGKVPLLIRPDGPHWLLIGECYIHGIMKGEAWNEGKCDTIWLK